MSGMENPDDRILLVYLADQPERAAPAMGSSSPSPLGPDTANELAWLIRLAAVAAVWLVLCIGMVLWARRLPPGLRDIAEFLPAWVTTARRLRRSPGVPRRADVALLVAVIWRSPRSTCCRSSCR